MGSWDEKGNSLLSKGVGTYQTTLTQVTLGIAPLISRKLWFGFFFICLFLKHWREIFVRSSPQQRGAHPSAVQGAHSWHQDCFTHYHSCCSRRWGMKKKKKNLSFYNTSIHIYLNNPYCPPVFQNQRHNWRFFYFYCYYQVEQVWLPGPASVCLYLSAGGSKDPLQGFFPCHPHGIQHQPCCKRLSFKQT